MALFFPDYSQSIVNLSATVRFALDPQNAKSSVPLLPELSFLSQKENIVLLAIDGMGDDFLKKYGQGSFLLHNRKRRLTSSFPSTTASAMTSLLTGVCPVEHGMTGWFSYLKELGMVINPLVFCTRHSSKSLFDFGLSPEQFFHLPVITETLPENITSSCLYLPKKKYSQTYIESYDTEEELFSEILQRIYTKKTEKQFIFSCISTLDTLSHIHGPYHHEVQKYFWMLDEYLAAFAKKLEETNTTLLITADHGFSDTPQKNHIFLEDHPRFKETLLLPLCGEPRVLFCYVSPEKEQQFLSYTKNELGYAVELVLSRKEVLEKELFGYGKKYPSFDMRVGDYIVFLKEGYVLFDTLDGSYPFLLGNHGGLSSAEMNVPLMYAP
jgi:predicted AlkP superfamily pyrophosphatase or phosphodiesterase